jgi:hypothetical protein
MDPVRTTAFPFLSKDRPGCLSEHFNVSLDAGHASWPLYYAKRDTDKVDLDIIQPGLLAAISIFLVANIYKSNPRNPLSAIPEQAKVIVLIRGAHFFQQQHIVSSSAYGALKSWPRLTGALDALAHLDSLSRHQDEQFHGLKDTRLALAAIPRTMRYTCFLQEMPSAAFLRNDGGRLWIPGAP